MIFSTKNYAYILLLVCCFPAATALAQAGSGEQVEVLLLTNGQVLRGRVVELGDRFRVTLVSGVETRIPRTQVELRCNSIEELYSWKAQLKKKRSLQEHLDLAEWCLREKLYPQTAQQLLAAMSQSPDHPRIEQIQRRLRYHLEVKPSYKSVYRKPRSGLPLPASFQQIEQTIKKTPPRAVQQYSSVIQPLLFNRCANGACHGANTKTDFRIFRPAKGRALSRRLTQRNLHTVLALVDRENPQDSKLLANLQSAHGVEGKPVFEKPERHYFRLLSDWVVQATIQPDAESPATIKAPTSNLSQTTSFFGDDSHSDLSLEKLSQKTKTQNQNEKDLAALKKADNSTVEYRPRDPFDAEIFNRQFHSVER